jgi:hypothetical protein
MRRRLRAESSEACVRVCVCARAWQTVAERTEAYLKKQEEKTAIYVRELLDRCGVRARAVPSTCTPTDAAPRCAGTTTAASWRATRSTSCCGSGPATCPSSRGVSACLTPRFRTSRRRSRRCVAPPRHRSRHRSPCRPADGAPGHQPTAGDEGSGARVEGTEPPAPGHEGRTPPHAAGARAAHAAGMPWLTGARSPPPWRRRRRPRRWLRTSNSSTRRVRGCVRACVRVCASKPPCVLSRVCAVVAGLSV